MDLELASMDDPEHFGPVFHRLTFAQAIEQDLLSDYQVVIVGVDDPTYRAYAEKGRLVPRERRKVENARTLAAQIGLAKAARDHDLRRIISFHSRVKKSQEFAASFPDVVAWMPESERLSGVIHADYVSGEMPSGHETSNSTASATWTRANAVCWPTLAVLPREWTSRPWTGWPSSTLGVPP